LGRKVHPIGFRLGIVEQHRSRWFAEGEEYRTLVSEDRKIRALVTKSLPQAAISKVEIERFPPNQVRVTVHSAKPGVIIGRKGATVNTLRNDLQVLSNKKVKLDIAEIEHPETDAFLVAESIAEQLQRRISHKRAMKQAVLRALKSGAKGCMIRCGGRLSGSESEAATTYGRIGIKVWIYKGEHLPGAD
jgi:small subunit ribosomal protein S3